MSHLRRRIDRLDARRPPGLSAITFLAEDPSPEAPAVERRGDSLSVGVGAGVNLHAHALDIGAFLPPGPEREAGRHPGVKVDLGIGPELALGTTIPRQRTSPHAGAARGRYNELRLMVSGRPLADGRGVSS